MADTTGVILAIGGITIANRVIFNGQDMDWKIPIATGVAAVTFSGIEKANRGVAVGLAYLALVAVVMTRIDPGVPSPSESALKWFERIGTATGATKTSAVNPTPQRVMQV